MQNKLSLTPVGGVGNTSQEGCSPICTYIKHLKDIWVGTGYGRVEKGSAKPINQRLTFVCLALWSDVSSLVIPFDVIHDFISPKK